MNKVYGVSKKQRVPVIFDPIVNETNHYTVFTDEGYTELTIDNFKYIKKHPMSSDYVLIRSDQRSKLTLEEQYNKFVEEANVMKTYTSGLVNMFRTGRNAVTAMKLLYDHLNELEIEAEDITEKEGEWLEKASIGAMVFGEKYEGKAWKYDINSHYPDIYSNKSFNVPIKQGHFCKISQEFFDRMRGIYKIGIYRAIVSYPDNQSKWKKLFRLNKSDYYTYYELRYAHKLGLVIDLIIDGEDNFLYFGNKCVSGSKFFGPFVKLLYPLKSKCPRAKQLLNCLWGSLSQSNEMIFNVSEEYESWNENMILHKLELQDDGSYRVTLINKLKRFETNYARIKPFLLAKGRVRIAQLYEDYVDNVKRVHTDGFISDIELPLTMSNKLGEFKLEAVGNCVIKNCNSVKFE